MEPIDILVVDDDPVIREMFEDMPPMGTKVYTAKNGEELVERAKEREYGLILADKEMPYMDGLEATRNVRLGNKNRNTPVWLMTGNVKKLDELKIAALEAGVNRLYRKPLSMQELAEDVEILVGTK